MKPATMKSTVTVAQLQAQAPRCVRRAEREGALNIARHGRPVAVLLSRERMEAIIETLEIMGNRKAMKSIRDYKAGRTEMKDVSCLNED
jgi:prevent-host-death family protein